MRRIKFFTGEYYHIYNRGVEKRNIFLENLDFFRFMIGALEFNRDVAAQNFGRMYQNKTSFSDLVETKSPSEDKELVGIVCYCLMPNHFHFILRQRQDNGISKFMHKMGTGYTNYFNLRHERTGALFQGTFKAKHIENEQYLLHLSRYIHLNPLDVLVSNDDGGNSKELLKRYKWSSLPLYLGRGKHSVFKLDNGIVMDQFKNVSGYEDFIFSNQAFSLDEFGRLKIDE